MSDSSLKKTDKKSSDEKLSTGAVVAVITALSSSGIFGLFSWFNDDDGNRRSNQGSPTTHVQQFITDAARDELVDLKGDWQFSRGDNLAWAKPSFDDSLWDSIQVPSRWESEGYDEYDGYAWYRKSFELEEVAAKGGLYLYLGRIDDIDETYINGQLVGRQGHFDPVVTAWDRNRIYRISEGVLSPSGKNVVAVRVLDTQLGGGIYSGRIGIFKTELPQPLLDLSGDWRFATGDDANWKEDAVDESLFKTIQVPMSWEAEGYTDYDGYAWYRKQFGRVEVPSSEDLVLVLGRIDDTDEVFLNGELIGKTGELDGRDRDRNSDFYSFGRVYSFSPGLLKDKNTIAVRVHDSGGLGGLYSGPVGIMTEDDYQAGTLMREEAEKITVGDAIDWLLGRD